MDCIASWVLTEGQCMATYILLLTLTPAGQRAALHDPEYLLRVEEAIQVPGVQPLGLYGVLGEYDFVTIVEADSNERIARFSLELGVRADVHITSLPAVPISKLEAERRFDDEFEAGSFAPEPEHEEERSETERQTGLA
jgi:uncharacterized protein with GYD domain